MVYCDFRDLSYCEVLSALLFVGRLMIAYKIKHACAINNPA